MIKKKQPALPELKEFKLDNDYNILNGEGRMTCFWMYVNHLKENLLICKDCDKHLGEVTDGNILNQTKQHGCAND